MGYMVELNTLLGLPETFNVKDLKVGRHYTIIKPRERAFPLHIAILIVDSEWNFYGYCVVNSAIVKDQRTELEFEVLSLFSTEQQKIYKDNFMAAAKTTGEVN